MVAQAQYQQGRQTQVSKVVGGVTRKTVTPEVDFSFSVELFTLPVVGGLSWLKS